MRELLAALQALGYDFTAVTPSTHQRVVARVDKHEAHDLRDVFGWNRPFRAATLPADLLALMERAGILAPKGEGLLVGKLRVASAGGRLFLHSAFPTEDKNAVFFGPDTYRFLRMLDVELPRLESVRRLVDVGAGSGAGAIHAAGLRPEAQVTLTDVNPLALRLARINAAHAGIAAELVLGSGLESVSGRVDLIVANPPYVMDESERSYRHGGGMHGAEVSLDWALAGARRLEPGGSMMLYTGVAIVGGRDALKEALEIELPPLGCTLRYEELDPDIFGGELEKPPYRDVERIAAVGAVIRRA